MDPVRLKLARQQFDAGGGFTFAFVPTAVKVKNIAFTKQVTAHFTTDGIIWNDVDLQFVQNFGDYDIFSHEIQGQVLQFVVRYRVAGAEFYDNNGGGNYHLGPTPSAIGGNVMLNRAEAKQGNQAGGGFVFTTSWLEGEILVRNLAFAKEVGIRLSVNGGATFEDVHASFAGSTTADGKFIGPENEVWRYKSPELTLNPSKPDFRFAVFYRNLASGEEFWDNNFLKDYKLSKAPGTIIG